MLENEGTKKTIFFDAVNVAPLWLTYALTGTSLRPALPLIVKNLSWRCKKLLTLFANKEPEMFTSL